MQVYSRPQKQEHHWRPTVTTYEARQTYAQHSGVLFSHKQHLHLMMMILYLFLQKQQIDYCYVPVWVHLREVEEKNMCDDVDIAIS
jgi:hypothetical protein